MIVDTSDKVNERYCCIEVLCISVDAYVYEYGVNYSSFNCGLLFCYGMISIYHKICVKMFIVIVIVNVAPRAKDWDWYWDWDWESWWLKENEGEWLNDANGTLWDVIEY